MPPPPASALAALVHTAEHLACDASQLTERAKAACAVALELRSATRIYRKERSAWATILAELPADPDRLVVLCAYCHRVRRENAWTLLPAGVEHKLKEWAGVTLSHGFCPDCLRTYFAPASTWRAEVADGATASTAQTG